MEKSVFRFVLLSLVIFSSVDCLAQGTLINDTPRPEMSSGGSKKSQRGGGTLKTKYGGRTRTVAPTKIIDTTPTTGTLAISTNSNAKFIVVPLNASTKGEAKQGVVPPKEKQFIVPLLPPGRYRVEAALEGYNSAEKEVVISRNQTTPVTLELEPITYDVTIRTNTPNGEVRYALITSDNQSNDKTSNFTQSSELRVKRIENGSVVLQRLVEGIYGIDIYSGEPGYEKVLSKKFTLPGNEDYIVEFKKLRSETRFYANFLSGEWIVPSTWQTSNQTMTVNGKGIAIPSDDAYQFYDDFEIISDVKMLDGIAASFVVRAQNNSNYYLIQITGKNASDPYFLSVFVVKNGAAKRLGSSVSFSHKASTVDDEWFKVFIKVKGNTFDVSLWDIGSPVKLGMLTDPYNTYTIGAPGIAATFDNHKTVVGGTQVCYRSCPPHYIALTFGERFFICFRRLIGNLCVHP